MQSDLGNSSGFRVCDAQRTSPRPSSRASELKSSRRAEYCREASTICCTCKQPRTSRDDATVCLMTAPDGRYPLCCEHGVAVTLLQNTWLAYAQCEKAYRDPHTHYNDRVLKSVDEHPYK